MVRKMVCMAGELPSREPTWSAPPDVVEIPSPGVTTFAAGSSLFTCVFLGWCAAGPCRSAFGCSHTRPMRMACTAESMAPCAVTMTTAMGSASSLMRSSSCRPSMRGHHQVGDHDCG